MCAIDFKRHQLQNLTKTEKRYVCFEQLYTWNIESLMPTVLYFQQSTSIKEVLFDCQTNIQSLLNPFHATFYLTFVVNWLRICSAFKRLKQILAEIIVKL